MIDDKRRRIPRLPFFKDERVGGTGMSTAQAMRLFIISSVVFAVVIAIGAFYLVNVGAKTDKTARTAASFAQQSRRLVDELKAQQAANHASRLADQARTDAEIRGILTCILAAKQPSDTVACLRGFLRTHPQPTAPKTTPGGSRSSLPSRTPTPGPTSPHASPTPRGGGSPTPGRTTRVTVPGPTVTRTHTAPAPPRATAPRPAPILPPLPLPLPLPSPVCNPIGLLHLC